MAGVPGTTNTTRAPTAPTGPPAVGEGREGRLHGATTDGTVMGVWPHNDAVVSWPFN